MLFRSLPGEVQTRAYNGIVPALANSDPAQAASLLGKVFELNRPSAAQLIMMQWLQTDPTAAKAWVPTAPINEVLKQRLLEMKP